MADAPLCAGASLKAALATPWEEIMEWWQSGHQVPGPPSKKNLRGWQNLGKLQQQHGEEGVACPTGLCFGALDLLKSLILRKV